MISEEHNLLSDLSLNNSERALESIFKIYSEKIGNYIFMFVKNTEVAEEILLDVFYTIWEQRKDIHEINSFPAFLYKIAKYKSLNYLRTINYKIVNIEDVPIDIFIGTKTTVEDDLISKETIEELNHIINTLPPKCKIAFKLIREDKMNYKDAAELLGVSVKTLENHITTANKKIREYLSATKK